VGERARLAALDARRANGAHRLVGAERLGQAAQR
jgi:hypothetical protein